MATVDASTSISKILAPNELEQLSRSVYLSNGEIVHFDSDNMELYKKFEQALAANAPIRIQKISNNAEMADIVSDIEVLLDKASPKTPKLSIRNTKILEREVVDPSANSSLTNFKTYDDLQSLMDTFNGNTHENSQCYNRAHMWTYEAKVKENAELGKLWIFFTSKYIKEYKYKWWFHVAPYGKVSDELGKYVVDRGFTKIPYNVTNWKNIFIQSKAECPAIKDYMEYENNQDKQDCYFIYSSQYYWQPYQLKNLSNGQATVDTYKDSDLEITFKDALIYWNGIIPRAYDDRYRPNTRGGSSSRFRSGDLVLSDIRGPGRVVSIIDGDRVLVELDGYRGSYTATSADLASPFGNSNGYYVGDIVFSINGGMEGKIRGIYPDGRVLIEYRYSNRWQWEYTGALTRNPPYNDPRGRRRY